MERIAVTQARRIETRPIVVNDRRAVDDFVSAVLVHVANRQVVIALTAESLVRGRAVLAVERSDACELSAAPAPGGEDGARVVAARHDEARPLAVEISDAGEEAVNAVAVAVAPDGSQLFGRRVELRRVARRDEVRRGKRRARQAVAAREVLGAFQDVAVEVVPPVAERGGRAFGAPAVPSSG